MRAPAGAVTITILIAAALRGSPSLGDELGPEGVEPFTPTEYASAVRETIEGRTVHATVGPAVTPLSLELSNYLLDNPDLSAFIVARRKIAPYRIVMRGPLRSLADDGDGTVGEVNLLSRTDRRRLYYGSGVHHSRLFPDIHASAVIVMSLTEGTGADGRPATTTTFEVYVRMRNRFLGGLIKTLRPFLQSTVIGKFSKAFSVADQVGRLIASDPAGALADAEAFPLLAIEDRDELRRLIAARPAHPAR